MQKTEIEPVYFRACPYRVKTLWRMRLSVLLLFTALLTIAANSNAQTVSITGTNLTLKQIFTAVKKKTGYVLLARESDLEKTRRVSIDAVKMPLKDLLDKVMEDQPVKYGIRGKTIFLSEKNTPAQAAPDQAVPVPEPLTGQVVDGEGHPVPGVTVVLKSGKAAGITDEKGRFSIAAHAGEVLVFTSIGYERQFVIIQQTNSFTVVLKKAESKLDEVQIIAYGQTSGRLSTGNVSSVKAKDIEKAPVSNPLLALAGRAPGIFITQATGFAGTGVQIQIQGQNSIANGTVPFYVIDGIPYVQSMLTPLSGIQGTSNSPAGGGPSNPLAFINPQDIESIDILKDADATAIYGSRAANGAILITTKKGKAGRTNVSVNIQHGFGEVAKKMDNLNTQQYLEMRKAAYTMQGLPVPGSGTTPSSTNYDLTYWDQNRYTDWQKVLIGGKAQYTDVQVSASGGSAGTQILLGANYHSETTVMPGNFSDKRGGVHFSMNHASADQRFKLVFGGNYLTDKNLLPGVDLTSSAMKLAPNAPALYDSTGKLNWETLPNGTETWYNPLRSTLRRYNVISDNLLGNAELSYRIWSTLTLKSTFGYSKLQTDEKLLTPQTFSPPSTTINSRSAFYSDKSVANWIIEPQLSYQLARDFGKFDFLLGTTFQRNKYALESFVGSGYSSDGQLENVYAAATFSPTNAIQETYNYNAVFGRLNYNFNDRYILNLTARRDGSSRFGSQNLFNNFYGIGGAWIFTKESWMKNSISFLSFGKLKASYGTTGNDQIGNYSFMSLYRSSAPAVPYGGGTTLRASSLSNPYLQWEETRKFNAGIDLGFLADRILLNFNYYRNRSSNQLLGYNLPILTGFNSISRNFGALVQNSGIEMAINTDILKGKDLRWSSGINLTIPRNKLVKFPGLETSSYATSLVTGKSLSIVKAFNYAGVNPETGRYNFNTPSGEVVELPVRSRDEMAIIDRTPRFYGGFQNTISYKGFSLDFLLQFARQKGYDETKFGYSSAGTFSGTGGTGNQPVSALNYWKQEKDNAALQRLNPNVPALTTLYSYASSILSDATWTDASYIRLKNLSFSYTLPVSLSRKAHLQQARIYAQGQNLLTITKYKGLDPENQSTFTLPPLRVITFGIQVSI